MKYQVTTQKEVRKQFKEYLKDIKWDGGETDTRCLFVDFVDVMQKDGLISEKLASKVTL